ncbi:class I SAM-dependent methyltransferase [Acidovorax sp. BLS4]|uniref:class I SAM-dependent methyltransferase n=1 Tax=Acidovorax sp. BLS4 TaxID=3273430 RepID=UPI002941FB25|nr:class I SAM-dependent methyltransferase [Paracidovorax avenae]WOI44151.1 class I SAM-dependent methyltransferase [Paracidovorax avenae]
MSWPVFDWRSLLERVGGRLLYRALRHREGRSYVWLRLTSSAPLFQDYGTTSMNRYPRLFAFVREALTDCASPRLLSFGCSTGEEVLSLRQYFPHADITGLDIHPGHIARCLQQQQGQPDPGMRFRVAGDTAAEATATYDAIFCLAVMRRGDLARHRGECCDHLIRFQDFDAQLEDFARCLRPGGFLVLRHANFRLRDARAARWFDPVLRVPTPARADTPLFGPDNRRLAKQGDDEAVFRRRSSPHVFGSGSGIQ